jgi:cell division septation protein DedD
VQNLSDQFGNHVFQSVVIVLLDAPDPVAPPEWNLLNVRHGEDDTQHFWTIQIGAYKDSPRRKEAAVEAVRAAREQGVEAYFYHGDTVSSVCVGVWPEQAVRTEGMKDGAVQVGNQNPDGQVIVAPGMRLPKPMQNEFEAKNLPLSNPRSMPVDPTMISMMERFPHHAINGEIPTIRNRRGEIVANPSPSLIVHIPVVSANLASRLGGPNGASASPQQTPEALKALMPEKPATGAGTGRLKSVGN